MDAMDKLGVECACYGVQGVRFGQAEQVAEISEGSVMRSA